MRVEHRHLPSNAEPSIRVLLVDDQEMVAAAVRNMLRDEPGIELHYCREPTKAIELANEIEPTVILQDLVMPEVDGLTIVRFFRANEKTREVPIVVLSSKEEALTKAESFASGANDYLVKFPDKLEVLARLRYHSNGYIARQERNQAYEVLARELAEAAEYVISLLPAPLEERLSTKWSFVPSTQLGGDSFGYHWIDNDHFAIYLLDVCGHGVGAALLSVSVLNVLRSHTLPDCDQRKPAEVLKGLNESFPMEEHNEMFFTMWYGVFNRADMKLTYASAGHPPAVLVDGPARTDAEMHLLGTKGIVIGAMPDMDFRADEISISAFSKLYVYSDGAYEIRVRSTGKLWTPEEWYTLLCEYAQAPDVHQLDTVREQVCSLQGADQFEDDFSLLEVVF